MGTNVKQEKIILLKEFLITQMNHWALFPLVVTAAGLTEMSYVPLWQWILCSLATFVLFLVRRYTNHFLILAASHVCVWGCFWFMPFPNLILKAVLMLYLTVYLLYSVFLRLRDGGRMDGNIHPGIAVAVTAGAFILQHYHGRADWDSFYVVSLILFIGLFFLHYYLERYLRFLAVNESSTGHIPEQEIFRSGLGLAAVYTAAGMLFLLLTSNIGWVRQIWLVFKRLLVWLLHFLPAGTAAEEPMAAAEEPAQQGGGLPPVEAGEPFWLWVLLEKLFMAAFFILIAAVALWGLFRLVKFLAARFRVGLRVESPELEAVRDVREKCGIERRRTEKKPFLAFLSPQERIRRIYKRRVWAARGELAGDGSPEVLNTLTARECGNKLEAEELAEVYEKARYSNEPCMPEDIKRAR